VFNRQGKQRAFDPVFNNLTRRLLIMETNTLVNMTKSEFKEMLEDIVEAAVG
jgi:hypothetical protein